MLVECINCQSSVEVLDDDAASSSCPVCGSDLPVLREDRNQPTHFPRQFGRYRLLELLGRGHFGAVWKAFDTRLQRTVALKMPRFIGSGDGMQEMFLREGRALARLRHPGIVSVFDVDEHNGVPYIASEFINGTTLSARLRDQHIRVEQAVEWTLSLADALEYAHQAGVIHRDLKPGNVMVDAAGRLLLTDFGLALRPHDDSVAAGKGQILGTPAYMSPEQARGESHLTDRRSDLYSLGVMLFEMVTGRLPFGGSGETLVNRVLNESPPRPRRLNPDVPKELESVILKLLEKSPERRYATASELAEDLRAVQQGEPLKHATVEPESTIIVSSQRPEFLEPLSPVSSAPAAFVPAGRTRRQWPLWLAGAAAALILSIGLLQFGRAMRSAGQGEADADPTVRPAPGPTAAVEPLPVVIVTDPPGAQVVAYPLDEYNSPRVDQAQRPEKRSPVDLKLLPGDYLVVAALDDGRFHEVYRRVPPSKFMLPDLLPHKHWKLLTDGQLELSLIRIPNADVAASMSHFPGAAQFQMGLMRDSAIPQHVRRVPGFLLDVGEVSLRDFKEAWLGQLPLSLQGGEAAPHPENFPVAGVWWDDAIAHAERCGKRLPTEAEYEFAATNGGIHPFPWGPDPAVMTEWEFGPVGQSGFDVATGGDKPVRGLFSNVAEWTSTRFGPYPAQLREVPVFPDPVTGDYVGSYVVRGGDQRVLERQPIGPDWQKAGARARLAQNLRALQPGLGFRCARSSKARFATNDFERVIDPSAADGE